MMEWQPDCRGRRLTPLTKNTILLIALSTSLAAGDAVALAFTAGSLLPVAKVLKGSFQKVDIVLAAGHDASSKQNAGLVKAKPRR